MSTGVRFRYRVVDVFTDTPLAGNALCVVLDPCPEPVMAAIAREVNLSETTFPVVTDDGAYDVRIFTPGGELPFAGHPTIGTAWALGPGAWRQTSPGATVDVTADAHGAWFRQPDPILEEVDPAGIAVALGLRRIDGAWRGTVGGTAHVLVPTDEPLDALRPDMAAVAELARRARGISLAPLRRVDDGNVHLRVFLPGQGIAEDPGTGSAAGSVAVLAQRLWGTAADIVIRQGDEIGRPCRLSARATPGDVRVGGAVAACAEGVFTL